MTKDNSDDGLVNEIRDYLGTLPTEYIENIIAKVRQHDKQSEWVSDLESCLGEAIDLMEDVVKGEYKPDSFTTQPWRKALNNIPQPPED